MTGQLIYEGISDTGSARLKNQDDYLIKHLESEDPGIFIAAVADGVGAFEQSELASAYITKSIGSWAEEKGAGAFLDMSFSDIQDALKGLVLDIHEQLTAIAKKGSLSYGSTLTLLFIIENSYVIVQVGDSRCYLLQDGFLRQITKDQTLAEKMRGIGYMDELGKKEESTLLQCIGQGEIHPSVCEGILTPGFQFLLCSDGMSNSLRNSEIAKELAGGKSEKQKLDQLLYMARQKGEKDNITAVLLRSA